MTFSINERHDTASELDVQVKNIRNEFEMKYRETVTVIIVHERIRRATAERVGMKDFILPSEQSYLLERIGDISQIGWAREYQLSSGKSRGVRAVDVRSGAGLDYSILPDRGMDRVASLKI